MRLILSLCALILAQSSVANECLKPDKTVLLYPEGQTVSGIVEEGSQITLPAREDNGLRGPEQGTESGRLSNVGDCARMDFYFPEGQFSKMVIVCPGGGYSFVSVFNEGTSVAQWLTRRGYAACVLKYRMPDGHWTVPIDDVQNALRYCRHHAAGWNVSQLGVMGFSAGGHLAAWASTGFVDEATRPDFSVLIYARFAPQEDSRCASMYNVIGSKGLRTDEEYAALKNRFCVANAVSVRTPRTFIALSADDRQVSPTNFLRYYEALVSCAVPCEVHIYPCGGHGWGFVGDDCAGEDSFSSCREGFYRSLEHWLSQDR